MLSASQDGQLCWWDLRLWRAILTPLEDLSTIDQLLKSFAGKSDQGPAETAWAAFTQNMLDWRRRFDILLVDLYMTPVSGMEILKATLKVRPEDKKKIMDAASAMIKPPADAGAKIANIPEYQFIAKELMSAGVLLDEAESFALKSLEFNKDDFAGSLRKKYAEWKRPAPSDEVIDREYLKERVAYRTTLGRIYVKRGKTPEGEQILREAYAASPTLSQAALGLADLAEQKGDNATAVDYLATATLSAGYAMADVRSRFEALYRKTHNDSIDGLEGLLDARYRKVFPNPIQVEPYKQGGASRTSRVVLAEFFTGAG